MGRFPGRARLKGFARLVELLRASNPARQRIRANAPIDALKRGAAHPAFPRTRFLAGVAIATAPDGSAPHDLPIATGTKTPSASDRDSNAQHQEFKMAFT